jgi:hypothetical protein
VELDFLKSAKEKDEMDVLLNILEKYAAVLFARCPGNYCNAFYLMASKSILTDGLS